MTAAWTPIDPRTVGGAACWHVDLGSELRAIGAWSEKTPGAGEDAEPLLLHDRDAHSGMIAVFDGVGGAGAEIAGRSADGDLRTHAWTAARLVRAATEDWYVSSAATPDRPVSLADRIATRLNAATPPRTSRVALGGMRRQLPSTLAALTYRIDGTEIRWTTRWAGDSRCYVLTPGDGLAVATVDDTHSTDALEQLLDDPPMTNYLAANRPFTLHETHGRTPLPAALVVATDGWFGYVSTPAEFESLLLSSMTDARSPADWSERTAAAILPITSDDASLAVAAIGWPGWPDVRSAFAERARRVDHMIRTPDALGGAAGSARERSWTSYRSGYERLLRDGAAQFPPRGERG